jgi:hypothetical protein
MTLINKEKFGRPCGVLCFICTCQQGKRLEQPEIRIEDTLVDIANKLQKNSVSLDTDIVDLVNQNFWDLT